MRLLSITLAFLVITGCGTPGAPQPPSANIPKPVKDLKAVRKGDTVNLSWSAPEQTTDGALVSKPDNHLSRPRCRSSPRINHSRRRVWP